VVPVSQLTLFFSADPIIFLLDSPCDPIFSEWLWAAHTAHEKNEKIKHEKNILN
jgi:hypothetical protein